MSWRHWFTIALAAVCMTFLFSTVWLYSLSEEQQRQNALPTASKILSVYGAHVSYNQVQHKLSACLERLSSCNIGSEWTGFLSHLKRLSGLLDKDDSSEPTPSAIRRLLDKYGDPVELAFDRAEVLTTVADDIGPLREWIKSTFYTEVAPALGPMDRERFHEVDVRGAFLLLVVSWGGLTSLLLFELKKRGELLREIRALDFSERELEKSTVVLLQSLPVPVLIVLADGTLVYSNRAARDLGTATQFGGDINGLAAVVSQSFGSLEPDGLKVKEIPFRYSDGSFRHLLITANAFRLSEQQVQVYVIADNTLVRGAELRALTVGKLAILGELSSAIAHELNQPLAVIKAAAANGRLRAASLEGSKPVVDKFERIDQQIERARRIIANVRKLARPQNEDAGPFSVARSLVSTFGLVSEQYRLAGISLQTDVSIDEGVSVVGDYILFEIAILNILVNAREAFTDSRLESGSAIVKVEAHLRNDVVEIAISDNAGGVSPDFLPRMFEPFVSSKSAETGMGLGLSITHRAIEGMRGDISAANANGGALFSIRLPRHMLEAA